jgi:hypothetical protein
MSILRFDELKEVMNKTIDAFASAYFALFEQNELLRLQVSELKMELSKCVRERAEHNE